jgi:hypothetical protein
VKSWDTGDVTNLLGELPPIWVPTEDAEKYRIEAENRRMRYARYNKSRPGRSHGKIPLAERPFIVWDGEGPRDTGYSLLGNSEGDTLCYPKLRTEDCLQLFLKSASAHPQAINTSYGFGYDISNVLWELPWRHLSALRKFGRTVWEDYQLEHIPHKWFKVKQGKTSLKIYDVLGFFQTGLVEALETWKVGPFSQTSVTGTVSMSTVPSVDVLRDMPESEIVRLFKSLRSVFTWADIESVHWYMNLELKYTKLMIEMLRQTFLDAGYLPKSWHGPAALAREAFTKHKVYDALAETPVEVRMASQFAFFGGRFETFFAGRAGKKVYVADINSAYPYYASQLPNLAAGTWRRGKEFEPGKFAVYYIDYRAKPDAWRPYPLPHRDKDHNVVFPHRTSGWYWSPEAELVADDPDATFREGWIFDEVDDGCRPFAWLSEYYRRRQLLKRIGNPAQLTFKYVINSAYGVLAQRAGWDRKKRRPPRTHQLEYAGYITSACRAAVYRQASHLGRNLVSIDTDGITSLVPFDDLVSSDEIGGWELKEYDDGVFWQSGIYCLRRGDKWPANKMRGIPQGSYSPDDLIRCMETGEALRLTRRVFYGYGLALQVGREKNNTWEELPVEYVFGGTGKRQHVTPRGKCTKECDGSHHRLALPPVYMGATGPCDSKPHQLPWLEWSSRKEIFDSVVMYETEEWENEQRWLVG